MVYFQPFRISSQITHWTMSAVHMNSETNSQLECSQLRTNCSLSTIFVPVTLTLNRWPRLNARKIKPSHYSWWLFQALCSKSDLLLPWPWTWPHDLGTQTWSQVVWWPTTVPNIRSIYLKSQSQRENSLPLPWTWPYDLITQIWPRYFSDQLTNQIWSPQVNLFKNYHLETETDTQTCVKPLPACSYRQ